MGRGIPAWPPHFGVALCTQITNKDQRYSHHPTPEIITSPARNPHRRSRLEESLPPVPRTGPVFLRPEPAARVICVYFAADISCILIK